MLTETLVRPFDHADPFDLRIHAEPEAGACDARIPLEVLLMPAAFSDVTDLTGMRDRIAQLDLLDPAAAQEGRNRFARCLVQTCTCAGSPFDQLWDEGQAFLRDLNRSAAGKHGWILGDGGDHYDHVDSLWLDQLIGTYRTEDPTEVTIWWCPAQDKLHVEAFYGPRDSYGDWSDHVFIELTPANDLEERFTFRPGSGDLMSSFICMSEGEQLLTFTLMHALEPWLEGQTEEVTIMAVEMAESTPAAEVDTLVRLVDAVVATHGVSIPDLHDLIGLNTEHGEPLASFAETFSGDCADLQELIVMYRLLNS